MYNRYIPNQDGSYQKNRIHNPEPERKQACPPSVPPCPPPTPPEPPCREPGGAGSFLRQLIPKNLDTGDLLIIVLLLLMAGDCKENQSTWLLTLALYLFL
jgi:hypothetical protein